MNNRKTVVFRNNGKKTQIIINGVSFFNKDNARNYLGIDKKAFRLLERTGFARDSSGTPIRRIK